MATIYTFPNAFPILETDRLRLRKLSDQDASDMFAMRSDERMHTYTDTKPDATIDETIAYINKINQGIEEQKWLIWAIEHKRSNRVIGTMSIWNLNAKRNSGELGFGIVPEYQGQGFMKEALQCIVHYGFTEMQLHIIEAYTEESNEPSIKLLQSCHFIETDRIAEKGYVHDKIYQMIVFSISQPN